MRRETELMMLRLLCDRKHSEQRDVELGRLDPLKELTGASSFDRAITSTQAMIEQLDSLISARSNGTPKPAPLISIIPARRSPALQPAARR